VVEGGAPGAGRRLLVLGAGPAQLGLLRAARARDLFVIAADRNAAAVGFPLADRRAVISAEDEQAIARLAEAEHVDGIIAPGTDWPVAIAARVAERLGLPHPISPDAAAAATTKTRQRELFDEAGVPQPRWLVGRAPEEAIIAPPCVVKPPDRQGQRGLSLVAASALGFLAILLLPVGDWLILPLESRFPVPATLPGRVDGIVVGAGTSGHAFKFGPLLGAQLAQLVLDSG